MLDHLTTTGPGHWGEDVSPPCGGNVQQIASNPVFSTGATALSDEDIQGWECSVHISFRAFPDDWNALAVATDTESKPTCGTDPDTKEPVCGEAYVLIAGRGIVAEAPNLTLAPKSSSDSAGGSHTVTATVSKEKAPVPGTVVSFVVTGQNAGATGTCTTGKGAADPTCETDAAGEVRFTYSDGNGAGTDTIGASVTIGETTEHATASEEWTKAVEEKQSTTLATSLSGAGKTGPMITVPSGTAVTDTATLSGANASTAGGTVSYAVFSDSECHTLVMNAGGGAVTSGVPASSTALKLAPGTYRWVASYSGDSLNEGSSSPCGSEILTVEKPVEKEKAGTGPELDGIASAQHYNEATATLNAPGTEDLVVAFVAADSPRDGGQARPSRVAGCRGRWSSGRTGRSATPRSGLRKRPARWSTRRSQPT